MYKNLISTFITISETDFAIDLVKTSSPVTSSDKKPVNNYVDRD